MAPAKPKAGSKRLAPAGELSPGKDVGIFKKPKQKKRKLSNMLGPQWSKQELERFYEGFRKYGHNWKKIANIVRNRSTEMVEALYNMNRAYLSLPEGTASVVGLIAMMTDHYSTLDGSGTEKDSDGYARTAKSPDAELLCVGLAKKFRMRSPSFMPSHSCLSSLKRVKGCDGMQLSIPVKKRTPRVPVLSMKRKCDTIDYGSPGEETCGLKVNLNARAFSNEASAILSEDKEKGGCHEVTSPIGKATEYIKHSKVSKGKKLLQNLKNRTDVASTAQKNEEHADLAAHLGKIYKEGKKRKKRNPESTKAFNGMLTEEENKKYLTEDESVAFDALQVLANISLTLPSATTGVESPKESANEGDTTVKSSALPCATVVENNDSRKLKKKPKTPALKKTGSKCESQSAKAVKIEPLPEEDTKPGDVAKEPHQVSAPTKPCKSAISSDVASINHPELAKIDVALSSSQVTSTESVTPPAKRVSRRKRALISDEKQIPSSITIDLQGTSPILKRTLHCISLSLLRKWCGFEWFYSAIDYPWFAKKEFVEYLNHVGLGHIPRLTRTEWGVIRSSLGKPRRFSERFLREERKKLQQYREFVRSHYEQLRAGLKEGLATDLARPLSVGQRVVAIHPKTREFHDGSILTVDHDKCRVQFDHPAFGVELVADIDCMPRNMMENLPETMRRLECGNMRARTITGALACPPSQYMRNTGSWICAPSSIQSGPDKTKVDLITRGSHSKVAANACRNATPSSLVIEPCSGDQDAVRDQHPSHSLDIKPSLENTSNCRKLPVINDTRHHAEETSSKVAEVVQGSRMKAHKMVHAAIEAISSLKQGEDTYLKIGEALESIGDTRIPLRTSQCPVGETVVIQNEASAQRMEENQIKNNGSNADGEGEAEGFQLPSELITSCVASLLIVQDCTERQYPPAEVAHILECAVTNLRPCYPQNMSAYREIQMCMGRIKTQILALIPS